MNLDNNNAKIYLLGLYREMMRIRCFELKARELCLGGMIRGSTHFCVGQEAVPVGISSVLRPDDYVSSTHRGHGHFIAKGGQMRLMFAEMLGRVTGYSKGKGGSMHMSDFANGFLGTNGIVGGGLGISIGAAFALKYQGYDRIVVCFLGDGALTQGLFHESLNIASLWSLPVLYVCENNQYAISLNINAAISSGSAIKLADNYKISAAKVDGNDVLQILELARSAVNHVRSGSGPFFIECDTYRWLGHSTNDPRNYRTRDEEETWKERCPIRHLENIIRKEYEAIDDELKLIHLQVQDEVETAAKNALSDPEPDISDLLRLVYV